MAEIRAESAGSVQTGTEPRAPVHSMSVGYEPARSGWIARCNCGASSPPGSREEVDGWAGDHWLDQWARGEAERHRAHGDPPDATRCLLDARSEPDDPAEIRRRAGAVPAGTAPGESALSGYIAPTAEERAGAERSLPDALVELVARGALTKGHGGDRSAWDAVTERIRTIYRDDARLYLGALFDSEAHVYWSTACLHGRHEYCACDVGLTGEKQPHTCKWCDAQCVCPDCDHSATPAEVVSAVSGEDPDHA